MLWLLLVMTKACKPKPVSLVVTLPYVPMLRNGPAHINETLLAIGENARSPWVREIRVLVDDGDSGATMALRKNILQEQLRHIDKLDGLATIKDVEKVSATVVGRQPTYLDLFQYVDAELANRTVALANADVVLRHLDQVDELRNLVLVVSVRTPEGAFGRGCSKADRRIFRLTDRCLWERAGTSWDVFIFEAPLRNPKYDILLEPARPLFMNQWGAENVAGHFLASSGYELANPCLHGIAEHWHCSGRTHNVQHYHADAHLAADAPGVFVPPSTPTPGICSI